MKMWKCRPMEIHGNTEILDKKKNVLLTTFYNCYNFFTLREMETIEHDVFCFVFVCVVA
jgi:hypothetical protein